MYNEPLVPRVMPSDENRSTIFAGRIKYSHPHAEIYHHAGLYNFGVFLAVIGFGTWTPGASPSKATYYVRCGKIQAACADGSNNLRNSWKVRGYVSCSAVSLTFRRQFDAASTNQHKVG